MKFLLRASAMAALFFAACSSTNNAPPPSAMPMPAPMPTMQPAPMAAPVNTTLNVPVEYHKLDNGLKVVLSPDHTSPVVTVAVYYGIGSVSYTHLTLPTKRIV